MHMRALCPAFIAASLMLCSCGDTPPSGGSEDQSPAVAGGAAAPSLGGGAPSTGGAGAAMMPGGSGGAAGAATVNPPIGGQMAGGSGASAGAAGGANADGGTNASAGAGASGGSAGEDAGAAGTAGSDGSAGTSGSGGSAGSAGSDEPGQSCPFPTSFEWTSTGPLAEPKSPPGRNFVSLKDFTVVRWKDEFHVYATVFDVSQNGWSSVYMHFDDFSKAAAAEQTHFTRNAVAPTLIYFTPKDTWVLLYQWGFQYATSADPSQPSSWSSGKPLLTGGPSSSTGPIDQTAICDDSTCYLFFAADNGKIYRSSMPIASFPGTFTNPTTILSDSTNNLFEGVQVYTVKDTGEYLMIVEAIGGGGRYFRAFRASDLGGEFKAIAGASTEATPFAGKNNVTFEAGAWTNDISHGDLVRTDPSETQTIDPCDMKFLYQGFDKTKSSSNYGTIPYRPGLLTRKN